MKKKVPEVRVRHRHNFSSLPGMMAIETWPLLLVFGALLWDKTNEMCGLVNGFRKKDTSAKHLQIFLIQMLVLMRSFQTLGMSLAIFESIL